MAGHRLLVVEDDASTRDALRSSYDRMGWHVSEAAAELKPDAMLPKPIRLPNAWVEPCKVCEVATSSGVG